MLANSLRWELLMFRIENVLLTILSILTHPQTTALWVALMGNSLTVLVVLCCFGSTIIGIWLLLKSVTLIRPVRLIVF